MTHFPVLHCCCTCLVSTQYVAMMTRYPPLANYATDNLHAARAECEWRCRLRHAQRFPGNRALTRRSRQYLTSAIPCMIPRYLLDLLAVPGLRLDRSSQHRHTMERRSDLLRPRSLDSRGRERCCSRGSIGRMERGNPHVWYAARNALTMEGSSLATRPGHSSGYAGSISKEVSSKMACATRP